MKKTLEILVKSFLAGLCISLGGWLSLRTSILTGNSVLAAFIFCIGLILICNFSYYLYTGKICYVLDKNEEKIPQKICRMSLILLGNFIGCLFMALLIRVMLKDNNKDLFISLELMVENKLEYQWWQVLGLSFFCGMLVYIAVEGFQKIQNNFGKYVVLMLCIAGFIIAGFEHSIADMFYLMLNLSFDFKSLIFIVLCVIGNSLGGVFIPLLNKIKY